MSHPRDSVNSIAPLANVSNLLSAMTSALESRNDDRIVVFYGHPGYGKTFATNYVRSKLRGYRVECCSHWGRKALLEAICAEMGIVPGNINTMFNAIVNQLLTGIAEISLDGQRVKIPRPLMIDEADHLVKNSCIELVRDLHDKGKGVVLLVGEEELPNKLLRWPRVHSRIIDPVLAVPCDLEDLEHLGKLYCPKITIAADWFAELYKQTGGNTRRACANLNRARAEAEANHLTHIDLAVWGTRGWLTRVAITKTKAV